MNKETAYVHRRLEAKKGGLEVIEGQEEFTLVKEGNSWRLFFDWASGVRVSFTTLVPQDSGIEAGPTIKETVTQPNEPFTIAYRVKNLTDKEVFARINHRVAPAALTELSGRRRMCPAAAGKDSTWAGAELFQHLRGSRRYTGRNEESRCYLRIQS